MPNYYIFYLFGTPAQVSYRLPSMMVHFHQTIPLYPSYIHLLLGVSEWVVWDTEQNML